MSLYCTKSSAKVMGVQAIHVLTKRFCIKVSAKCINVNIFYTKTKTCCNVVPNSVLKKKCILDKLCIMFRFNILTNVTNNSTSAKPAEQLPRYHKVTELANFPSHLALGEC